MKIIDTLLIARYYVGPIIELTGCSTSPSPTPDASTPGEVIVSGYHPQGIEPSYSS